MIDRKLGDRRVWSVVRYSPGPSQHSVITLNTLTAVSQSHPAVWLMILCSGSTSGSGDVMHTVVVDVGNLAGALVGGRWQFGGDGGRQLV